MPIVEADPACPGAARVQPPLAVLVRDEQIRAQYAGMPVAFVGSALCATLLGVTLAHRLTYPVLALWLLLAYGNSGLRALLWYRFTKDCPASAALPRWQRRLTVAVALGGMTWGTGGILLHVPGSFTQQIFVLLVMIGMALTALLIAGGSMTAFVVFIYPLLCLSAVPFLMTGDGAYALIGVATLMLLPVMTLLGRRLALNLTHTIETRLSHRQLLEQLSVQKQAAEEASRAKSRFLATASHDLRQPLHALNLFVQALQERRLPPHERELVANVRRSVDAMDELFDALLDISRLDAGAVRSRVATFPLEELFERLRFEFAGLAQEKGLRFTVQKTRLYVRSDPELLSQILRNLLANALRYTARGGVLMGCRRGAGRLRIEVWDTGCGIPHEQHPQVFQEFTQLGNPERDRRKGLGLGLAIVDRLVRLLEHSITLRSTLGRGSMFAVSVPRGEPAEHVPPVHAGDLAGAFNLSGLHVLLIDDDLTARAGQQRLLSRWHCQVTAAASGAEAIQLLGGPPPELRRPPDIIIVDYRLREQASGVTVLQQLQGELGGEMPALVVTAGSAQERRDCEASGVPVLGKPVNAARLRTLLAHVANRAARAGARRAG
jgi:signal transduction histidine kinase/ActR/RegA family two-component response regulator